jgi:hypothetical protein
LYCVTLLPLFTHKLGSWLVSPFFVRQTKRLASSFRSQIQVATGFPMWNSIGNLTGYPKR